MITRCFPALALAFLLAACSTAKPASEPVPVDPLTDPSIVGAVDEAVLQGSNEAVAAARTGRRIGRVAGVLAAVFAGPESESLDDTIDRYRQTRNAAEATGAVIGATKGAVAGAKRGYELDLQFAELHEIEGLEVMRPFPDEIEARFAGAPSAQTLSELAAVFVGREERAIDILAAGNGAVEIREALIALGVPGDGIDAHRDDEVRGVVLRVRYRG